MGTDSIIYIRADGNSKIATGHLVRCLSIAQELLFSFYFEHEKLKQEILNIKVNITREKYFAISHGKYFCFFNPQPERAKYELPDQTPTLRQRQ